MACLEGRCHDDDGGPAGPSRGVVAATHLEVDPHVERLADAHQPVDEHVLVMVGGEEHREGEVVADDDLLEVEHRGADAVSRVEERHGHPGPVAAVEGHEQGPGLGVRQRCQGWVGRVEGHPCRLPSEAADQLGALLDPEDDRRECHGDGEVGDVQR